MFITSHHMTWYDMVILIESYSMCGQPPFLSCGGTAFEDLCRDSMRARIDSLKSHGLIYCWVSDCGRSPAPVDRWFLHYLWALYNPFGGPGFCNHLQY